MALYSWFSKTKNNQSANSQLLNRESKALADQNKYLESYTMWPVAVVIQGGHVTPPVKSESASNKDENTRFISAKSASLCTVLTVTNTGSTA